MVTFSNTHNKHLKLLVTTYFKSGEVYSVTEIKEAMHRFAKECNITIKDSKEVMTLGCIMQIKETTKRENGKVIKIIRII